MVKGDKMKINLYGDDIGKVELVDHMGSDLTIVNAARVSFGVHKNILEEKDENLIKYLIKNQHTSPFEHCVITYRFKVPLFVRSQHHRHRTWSYNEISRRYTNENLEFYEPKEFRTQSENNRQASNERDLINPLYEEANEFQSGIKTDEMIRNHHKNCVDLYNKLLIKGICREQARGVLPQNLYTEYYGTVNLNNLLKFIKLRDHQGTQWEIVQVAKACKTIGKTLFPVSFSAFI